MGKKQKEKVTDEPNPNSVKDRDVMQRLNFLYQTSVYLAQASGAKPTAAPGKSPGKQRKREGKNTKTRSDDTIKAKGRQSLMDLSRLHTRNMKTIGNKAVLRMDPTVKRTVCKGCQVVLIPGVTAKVRIKCEHATNCHLLPNLIESVQQSFQGPNDEVLKPPFHGRKKTKKHSKASSATSEVQTSDPTSMDVETSAPSNPTIFRLPPLFEREVGHVVFVGNKKVAAPQPSSQPDPIAGKTAAPSSTVDEA
ncbi:hypothetical protein FRB99_000823 [Tulasnella sp. 403]|nr:hypothetical protein FRB99_000823 [Tulasnella sp. 403]